MGWLCARRWYVTQQLLSVQKHLQPTLVDCTGPCYSCGQLYLEQVMGTGETYWFLPHVRTDFRAWTRGSPCRQKLSDLIKHLSVCVLP